MHSPSYPVCAHAPSTHKSPMLGCLIPSFSGECYQWMTTTEVVRAGMRHGCVHNLHSADLYLYAHTRAYLCSHIIPACASARIHAHFSPLYRHMRARPHDLPTPHFRRRCTFRMRARPCGRTPPLGSCWPSLRARTLQSGRSLVCLLCAKGCRPNTSAHTHTHTHTHTRRRRLCAQSDAAGDQFQSDRHRVRSRTQGSRTGMHADE